MAHMIGGALLTGHLWPDGQVEQEPELDPLRAYDGAVQAVSVFSSGQVLPAGQISQ